MTDTCRRCKASLPAGARFCPACGTKQEISKGRRQRGNGTGTAYKRGKTWTAVYIPGWKNKKLPVKRTKGGFATKREALEHIPVLRGGKPRKTVTLAQLYASYESTKMQKLSDSKQREYRKAFERIADIAYIGITELTIDDLQRVANMQKTYFTRVPIKNLLSHLFARAMAEQVVAVDLSKFIELPEPDGESGQPFTEEELLALWADYESGNLFTGYALLMIYTGMMPGELFICEKPMIDWERQEIMGCGLKTRVRRETPLVFPDFITPVLRDLCDLDPSKPKLLVVPREAFYAEFQEMLIRCSCRPDLHPYSCRHTTATALALAKIAPPIIQRTMRHASFDTTQGYIHIDTSPIREALNSLRSKPTDNLLTTSTPQTQ